MGRQLKKDEILRFLDAFQKVAQGDEGKRKLISLRVPEKLLDLFRKKSEAASLPYQTQLVGLMRQWVTAESGFHSSFERPALSKVISGGQTGVDRAALDVCLKLGVSCGGWCPKGRIAEDGVIPVEYPLTEAVSGDYEQRTEWNVRDSDATLILTWGKPKSGTLLTYKRAVFWHKPVEVIDLQAMPDPPLQPVLAWIARNEVHILNIAGPRASFGSHVYAEAYKFIMNLLSTVFR